MKKFFENKTGQSLTEFALILPILIVLIFGGIDAVMTSNQQTKIDSFYGDLVNQLITNCPTEAQVWAKQNSTRIWETNPSAIPEWSDSIVKRLAKTYSLNEKQFMWLSPNGLSANMDNSLDFANPTGQTGAQQVRVFKTNTTAKGDYFRIAFKYKQTTITSYIFDKMYETNYNKEILCSKK